MFVLKRRKYNWLDMWRMPFESAPFATTAVTAQKLITALVNVFQVVVVAKFLDGAIAAVTNKSFDRETILWFILMLLIVGWKRVSFHLGTLFSDYARIQANKQISEELTNKRNRMEYYLLEDPKTEELSNRITGQLERNLWNNLQWFLNLFAINIPRIVGVLLIMSGYVWWLSLVVLALTLPLFFFSLKSGKKVYRAMGKAAVFERRHKYLFSLLTGRETVEERSLFGYTSQISQQWHGQYEEARKLNLKSEMMYAGNSLRGVAMNSLLTAVVVLVMIPLTVSGRLTVGVFISLATSMYDLIDIMGQNTSRAVNQIATAQEFMKDVTAFAALPEREDVEVATLQGNREKEWGVGKTESHGEGQEENEEGSHRNSRKEIPELEILEFRHVTFRYPETDVDILKDFSLKLEKGRHYAIVGENGAGKSTLIKLLTGLYREYEGEILYNGMEMRTFPRRDWFRIFSCVFQDFARYYLSVEENICLGTGDMGFAAEALLADEKLELSEINSGGNPGETEVQRADRLRRMEDAAKQLDIHDALSDLKYSYQTRLGKLDEDSMDLSGGQWQRVAMARALMNDAPFLILDEPTAALDPISESRLYEEFGRISRNRTTIFISHRLGSTRLSDHIFVLKDGCVREQGSHSELMELQGIYANMYETQRSWYDQEKGGEEA